MCAQSNETAETLFAEALALSPPQRQRFLTEACADDPGLRREVESLLAAHDASREFLEVSALSVLPGAPQRTPDDSGLIGNLIGSYRLTRLIGAGGMGRVYESEQGAPRRTVALKLLNGALVSAAARRRFEYEAEVLARLHHPGIAQIYEAGIHEDRTGSIPYFAMEYVPRCRSIVEHAAAEKLGRHERLALFADVCDAVHHGHQKGIIHRDLKPGNILVNQDGKPKVIDFGVARAVEEDGPTRTRMTCAGELVGTLQYMSPEQCTENADAIDIRSDVYSLGLVLFELLTGERPYELSQTPLVEAARIIREGRVPRPSTHDRALRGDLDNIVLKSLEKDRDRRYASAADLAQDIRRYLRCEPVEAHPPSAVYQLRKLVSRYRVPAVLVGLLALAITVLAVVTTVMSANLAAERDRAEAEAETVRRIEAFQKDLLIAAAPRVAQGRDVTVREVLDEAAAVAGEKLGDSPEVEGAIRDTIGQAYHGLARYDDAETQYLVALDLRRSTLGDADVRTLNTMNNLAVLYADQGRYAEAAELHGTVLAEQRRQLGPAHPDTVGSALNYAFVLDRLGRRDEAITLLEEMVAICNSAFAPDARETITAVNSLAVMYAKEGRYADAAPLFEQAYSTSLESVGPDHPGTITAQHNLARLYEHIDQLEEAESTMREVVAKRTRVLGPDHPDTLAAQGSLGRILRRMSRFDEAEAVVGDVLDNRRAQLGPTHPDTLTTERDYANILLDLHRPAEAEAHLSAALAGFEKTLPPTHELIVTTRLALGVSILEQQRYAESAEILEEVLTTLKEQKGIAHPTTQRAARALLQAYESQGETESTKEIRAMLTTTDTASAPND